MMPYRVILTITDKKIQTPGPLTREEAEVLAKHHNEMQLLSSWRYSVEYYKEDSQSSTGSAKT